MLIDYAENSSPTEQIHGYIQRLIDTKEWRGVILTIARGGVLIEHDLNSPIKNYASGMLEVISSRTLENTTGVDGGIMLTSLKYILKKLFANQSDADWRKLISLLGLKNGIANIIDQDIEREFIVYYIGTWPKLKPSLTQKQEMDYATRIRNNTQNTFENYIKREHGVKVHTTR